LIDVGLIRFFSAGGEDQAEVITFDIPWTLAEQIYLHWVSNVLDRQPEPAPAWTTTPSSSAPSPTTATTAAPSAWAEGPAASGRAVHQNAGPEPQELRRIMDFELAMELAHQEVRKSTGTITLVLGNL